MVSAEMKRTRGRPASSNRIEMVSEPPSRAPSGPIVGAVNADIPKIFAYLFEPMRYKVAYGGRGSGKSWNYARALIIKAVQGKIRVLCAREIQKSIRESVHKLLEDQIEMLGLKKCFAITDTSISCKFNGSEFFFEGLFRNVNKIKSIEGIDVAWVEEAEAVSEESWQLLLPTVRKSGSEVWITFNTKYEDDPTYQRFVTNKPEDCSLAFVNWWDNPHFPNVLEKEKDQDYAYRPYEAANIWGGEPVGRGRKVWPDFLDKPWPNGHVREFDWELVRDKAQVFMAMDPAQHYYPACIWVARIPKDERCKSFYKWVLAEWPRYDDLGAYLSEVRKKTLFTGTCKDMAREWMALERQYGLNVERRYIDTRFAKGSGSSSYFSSSTLGIVAEFAKHENGGLEFDCPGEKMIDSQKSAIIEDMRYNSLIPLGPMNEPSYFVAPWCRNVRQCMGNHRLEEDCEQESDKYKDFSDTHKICWSGMADVRYSPPVERLVGTGKKVREFGRYGGDDQDWMMA